MKYNDLHTVGLGYLNRARTVNPKSGKSYEAVSLTALAGRVDEPQYVYFDCSTIKGKALAKYLLLKESISSDAKVMVRFKVSDGVPESYQAKDGQLRHIIKCRLLDITWASIDGQEVQFEIEIDEESEEQEQVQPATTSAAPSSQEQTAQPESLFSDDELDEFVKLDRDDPLFFQKKDELKSLGYRWDSREKLWHKPAA